MGQPCPSDLVHVDHAEAQNRPQTDRAEHTEWSKGRPAREVHDHHPCTHDQHARSPDRNRMRSLPEAQTAMIPRLETTKSSLTGRLLRLPATRPGYGGLRPFHPGLGDVTAGAAGYGAAAPGVLRAARWSASAAGWLSATRCPPGRVWTASPSRSRATRRCKARGKSRSSRLATTVLGTAGQPSSGHGWANTAGLSTAASGLVCITATRSSGKSWKNNVSRSVTSGAGHLYRRRPERRSASRRCPTTPRRSLLTGGSWR